MRDNDNEPYIKYHIYISLALTPAALVTPVESKLALLVRFRRYASSQRLHYALKYDAARQLNTRDMIPGLTYGVTKSMGDVQTSFRSQILLVFFLTRPYI